MHKLRMYNRQVQGTFRGCRSCICLHFPSVQVDGESHVLHTEEEAMGTRLVVDNLSCLIAKEADPSRLVAQSPGKLVRQLVQNGEHVQQGQPFAEVEVMKMMMPLVCSAAGVITFLVNEGAALNAGELIAKIELDDPTKVKRADEFKGALPPLGPPQVHSTSVLHRFKQALSSAKSIMAGEDGAGRTYVINILSSITPIGSRIGRNPRVCITGAWLCVLKRLPLLCW